MMLKRTMPKIQTEVPLLGFGGMRMPTKEDGTIDVPAAAEMVQYAMDNGVNYFDTAYMYHSGKSENFFGEVLPKYPRESYYLASKFPVNEKTTKEDVYRIFQDQLNKCKTEYFDFYLIHAFNASKFARAKEIGLYELLKQFQAEGKIKRLGFSFHDKPEVLDEITDTYPVDFVQIQLNYLDWHMQNAEKSYQILEKKEIPCIVMEPVRGGFLHNLPAQMTAVLKKANPEASNASLALRWVAQLPNVKVILSGMSNMEQIRDNVAVLSDAAPLNAKETEAIHQVVDMILSQKTIPCTGCAYCMECPKGVDIPKVFAAYNDYVQHPNVQKFLTAYEALGAEHQGHNCVSCGACVLKCPQQIEIFKELAKIQELVAGMK